MRRAAARKGGRKDAIRPEKAAGWQAPDGPGPARPPDRVRTEPPNARPNARRALFGAGRAGIKRASREGNSAMSRVCQVTGKRPMSGNHVSHANNKTRRRFLPNLHSHRFWVESEQRWVKLRVSTKGLRSIDKHGIDAVLAGLRRQGAKV